MIQFCIFGGHDGRLSTDPYKLYFTMFGGCKLQMPTIASQILAIQRSRSQLTTRRMFFVTIFGATEIQLPTLVEEFFDAMHAMQSSAIEPAEWDRLAAQLTADDGLRIGSFTLFAGFDSTEMPSEDQELDRIALAYQLGQINDATRQALMLGIGTRGPQRVGAIRMALSPAYA